MIANAGPTKSAEDRLHYLNSRSQSTWFIRWTDRPSDYERLRDAIRQALLALSEIGELLPNQIRAGAQRSLSSLCSRLMLKQRCHRRGLASRPAPAAAPATTRGPASPRSTPARRTRTAATSPPDSPDDDGQIVPTAPRESWRVLRATARRVMGEFAGSSGGLWLASCAIALMPDLPKWPDCRRATESFDIRNLCPVDAL
jgi:hypothetical protein